VGGGGDTRRGRLGARGGTAGRLKKYCKPRLSRWKGAPWSPYHEAGERQMKLGANSVLFGGFDLPTAFEQIALAGYDGIELSAIDGMSEPLVLKNWRSLAPLIKQLSRDFGLELLAMEQPSQDPAIMEQAFQAAVEIGIPIINCGPGGKSNDEASLQQSIESIGSLAQMAERYGVTLCVKGPRGPGIFNTPTT